MGETEDEKYDETEDDSSLADNNMKQGKKVATRVVTRNSKKKRKAEVNKNLDVKQDGKAEAPRVTRNSNKQQKMNIVTDDETSMVDDVNHEWDIERDKTKQYYYSNKKKLNKKAGKFQEIGNHRKMRGYEGELLVLYDDGVREWIDLYVVFDSQSDDAITYMCENNLTKEQMDFGFEKKRREEEEKLIEEGKTKGKNKKVEKNSNIQQQDNQATIETNVDNGDPFVCSHSEKHNLFALKIHEDSKDCTDGLRFDGVQCALCPGWFVHKRDFMTSLFKDVTTIIPSCKFPKYCCENSKEYCTYAVCFGCRHKEAVKYKQSSIETSNT